MGSIPTIGLYPTSFTLTHYICLMWSLKGDQDTVADILSVMYGAYSTYIFSLRDWSLIKGRGGGTKGKIAGPKLFAPPSQDRVNFFAPPPI